MYKFLIVESGYLGPIIHRFNSTRGMVCTLTAWALQGVANSETQTAWEWAGEQWKPMAPWLHGRGAA